MIGAINVIFDHSPQAIAGPFHPLPYDLIPQPNEIYLEVNSFSALFQYSVVHRDRVLNLESLQYMD